MTAATEPAPVPRVQPQRVVAPAPEHTASPGHSRLCPKPGGRGGLAVLVLVVLAAVFAPLIASQNPYDLRSLNIMDSRLAPGEAGFTGTTLSARDRRAGARHVLGHPLRAAHLAVCRADRLHGRTVDRADDGAGRGLFRRADGHGHHAAGGPAPVLPADPGCPDPSWRPGARGRQDHPCADHRPMGDIRTHGARHGPVRASSANTSRPPSRWALVGRASCSGTSCRTACRR
jgi:hypothetical protein